MRIQKELDATKWDDAEVLSGKWVSSNSVCTVAYGFGGPIAQRG